jgi:hypothetical protein
VDYFRIARDTAKTPSFSKMWVSELALGAFGVLNYPTLEANFGILDQIVALRMALQ